MSDFDLFSDDTETQPTQTQSAPLPRGVNTPTGSDFDLWAPEPEEQI